MRHSKGKHALAALLFLAIFAGLTALVMVLWNWLIPTIFGLGVITYWQALGIMVLSKILFGFSGKGHSHWHHRHRQFHRHRGDHAEREAMKVKLRTMSRTERAEYIRNNFDHGGWHGENPQRAEHPDGKTE